jgi:hypothetical protein
MTIRAESLRRELRELTVKRGRGDVPERAFQKQNEDLTVALCRQLVEDRLSAGERILAEHHVVRAHTKLAGSVLRESEQESIALLATDQRLFRLTSRHQPDEPALFAAGGRDQIAEVPRGRISGMAVRRQVRSGEILVGVAVVAAAVLFGPWLHVTGTALALLGGAGVLHGLLVPTRWAEIVGPGPGEPDFRIYALRKRSAKKLMGVLSGGGGEG